MGDPSVTPGMRARGLSGLSDLVYGVATEEAHAEVFSVRGERGRWERVKAGGFATEVTAVAKGLVAAGVGEGDRVVVVSGSHQEWVRLAFAVWSVRAVLVPLPESVSAERLVHVVRQTRPAAAVVQGERLLRTVSGLQRELPDLGRVWRMDAGLADVVTLGAYMDASSVRFRRDGAVAEDVAVVLYPVSTVSRSTRGVVLSHGALLSAAADVVDRMWPRLSELPEGRASTLLDLPLSQISGLASLVACMVGRVRVGLAGATGLMRQVEAFKPTVLVCSAGVLQGVFSAERGSARSTGWDSLGTFNAAVESAVQFDRSPRRSAWQRLSRSMYDWQFSRVRELFGGRVHLAVCWGGGLSDRLDSFFGGVGIPVVQAFGTAEAAGVFVAGAVGDRVPGTVGRALEGREVWVSGEGEIHVRGGAVFSGYWGEGEASRSAFREGWLATGYAGEVDADGVVSVVGRLRVQAATEELAGRFVARGAGDVRALEGRVLEGPEGRGRALEGRPAQEQRGPEGRGAEEGVSRRGSDARAVEGRALEAAVEQEPGAVSGGDLGEMLAVTAAFAAVDPAGGGELAVVEPQEQRVERGDAELVAEFEARLRAHPLISQVLVIVEGRPFASALVTLVRDQLEYWRLVNGRPLAMAPEEIAGDRELLREVQGLVYEANRSVPRHLAVRSFHVLAEEFTVQSGLVHASGELRREAVLRAFAEEIDGLYRVRREQ
ncbi:AMP-binding protein [Nocardiopsis alborubida]|uniref:AMP-binding protein n=2 Tax=Nocardiopsis alborubida TaxID=146802 RepID=A0A7X6MKU1_9ACTN|nr:AMP-binding protein [Nocardiopsis alborubida]NKZ01326.1 AMP-binding protein [Nocardiopsis alborubida]